MKKEVTLVPKDKSPMDILAEIAERQKSAWIFLDSNLVCKLKDSSDSYESVRHYYVEINWNATENFPATFLSIEDLGISSTWYPVHALKTGKVNFRTMTDCGDPEEILFWKLED